MKKNLPYQGLEQGPIRPPSEADSLCLRITRNCHWNRCTFCPVYKGETFSLRSAEDVIQDIDTIFRHTETLRTLMEDTGQLPVEVIRKLRHDLAPTEQLGFRVALNWFLAGMESVFLQDANSLIIKTVNLLKILNHLKQRFPQIRRITSYARSQTVAKLNNTDLRAIREAGLNRLHIGFESGSDRVLALVNKGATKALHIVAGNKAKAAGMELSEYYMPGLGGQDLSREHALESADALNQMNPDFIRIRSLAISPQASLFEDYQTGRFKKCTDTMIIGELGLFLENLQNITSTITSDHFLNLFPEVEGRLPEDREKMVGILREFLNADPEKQRLYQVGRRMGFLSRFNLLDDPLIWAQTQAVCCELGVTADNVDDVSEAILLQHGL
jgi:hypothetical protein